MDLEKYNHPRKIKYEDVMGYDEDFTNYYDDAEYDDWDDYEEDEINEEDYAY